MNNYKSLIKDTTFLSSKKTAKGLARDILTLRENIQFFPETGTFLWIKKQPKIYSPGDVAGRLNTGTGYIFISIFGVLIRAHRLAWLMHYDAWPAALIDHINGIRSDNRICNLRAATAYTNAQNRRRAGKRSETGLLGVLTHKYPTGRVRYEARIRAEGTTHRLGRFSTPEAAHCAYLKAKRQLHEGCTL